MTFYIPEFLLGVIATHIFYFIWFTIAARRERGKQDVQSVNDKEG